MFARHLPPSAGLPRVLALDAEAAAELAEAAQVIRAPGEAGPGVYDAVAGTAEPSRLPALFQLLRPGGRLILAAQAEPRALLAALEAAGCIHCLVEPGEAGPPGLMLYRGERPPQGSTIQRHRALAGDAAGAPAAVDYAALSANPRVRYLFLLINQQPNKPAWKLEPDERLDWRAATLEPPGGGQPHLLVFSSLARAVAFMQPAVVAGRIAGVNKVGKFPLAAAQSWSMPMLLNAIFDSLADWRAGPSLSVDPDGAITGEE
jgi:hypothetical protein